LFVEIQLIELLVDSIDEEGHRSSS
jgi:hypothetical protein